MTSNESQTLQVGLIGFGQLVRQYYLPALQNIPHQRISAIVDPLSESSRSARKNFPDAAVYDNHRSMLERSCPQCVLIATPPSTHLEIWQDSIARGLPVFVEKPLLLASQISSLKQKNGDNRIMIDFNRRFWPNYISAKQLVHDRVIGTPVHLEFGLHLDVMRWSNVTKHRLNPIEGGVLHDLGCHGVDVVTQLIGNQPVEIAATSFSQQWKDDHVRLSISFHDGSSAMCDLAYEKQTREWLNISGPEGRIHFAEPNMALHVQPKGVSENRVVNSLRDLFHLGHRGFVRSNSMARASIAAALANFFECVRRGDPFSPGFQEGFENALQIAAAARSAASNGAPQRVER